MIKPFEKLKAKLELGQECRIVGLGDSTMLGVGDTLGVGGWFRRLMPIIANEYGYNWSYRQSLTGLSYGSVVNNIINGAGAPMINAFQYGISGSAASSVKNTFNPTTAVPAEPDLVIMCWGVNDLGSLHTTGINYANALVSIFTEIKDFWGADTPILIITQAPPDGHGGHTTQEFRDFFSVMTNMFVGQSLPLDPYVIKSLTYTNVWVMDTWKAYDYQWSSAKFADVVHPNATGYAAQAQWMFDNLKIVGQAPIIETLPLGAMLRGEFFEQIIGVTGTAPFEWSIESGNLPNGIDFENGLLRGVPSKAGPYSFILRVENDYGFDVQIFTGEVGFNALPFLGNTPAGVTVRLMGMDYPVDVRVKIGDQLRKVTFRA